MAGALIPAWLLWTLVGTGAAAGAGSVWGGLGSGDKYTSQNKGRDKRNIQAELESSDGTAALELWNSLSEAEKRALETEYLREANSVENLWGIFGNDRREVDVDALLKDLSAAASAEYALPAEVKLSDYVSDDAISSRVAELTAGLDALKANREQRYLSELQDIQNQYALDRSNLLRTQYQQNMQIMDTLQSDMAKARRNALEAGASAGLRLVDNINATLSAQNKQAQMSLDTSNQLAQMLLNKQSASRQAQASYDDYMHTDYTARNNAREQAYNEGYRSYDAAKSDYESRLNDWERAYGSNPVSKYKQSSQYRTNYSSNYNN